MKIFKKIDQNVWEDTSEDDNGIILANCIKLEGFDILIFCFNDRNNIQRIIFENTNRGFINDPNLDTIAVDNVNYSIGTEENKLYLDLSCKIDGFKRYFINFSNDIINHISLGFNLFESYQKVYHEWKAFLYKKATKLSLEEQYGLISELYFLIELFEFIDPIKALNAWRGPFKEVDFKFIAIDFEVKSTLKRKHEHIINGLDQLLLKKDKLGLISFRLTKVEDDGGLSLPDYVEKVEQILDNYPSLLIDFKRILTDKLNYDVNDISAYNINRFEIIEIYYFNIHSTFPSLTINNFKEELPQNISKIEYTLDFTNLDFNVFDKEIIKILI